MGTNLKQLIRQTNKDEASNLSKILKCEPTVKDIDFSIQWHCQNKIKWLFTDEKTYYQILKQVAKNSKVEFRDGEDEETIERKLLEKVFLQAWKSMNEEQKREFEDYLKDEFKRRGQEYQHAGNAAAILAILAAQQSGFGIYLLSSVALSTISKALGISLAFATYTGASRLIAFLIGPAGWALTGVMTIWTIAEPNKKVLLGTVIQLIQVKNRLKDEGKGDNFIF